MQRLSMSCNLIFFFFFGGLFESLAVTNLGAVDAKGIYAHESPSNPS